MFSNHVHTNNYYKSIQTKSFNFYFRVIVPENKKYIFMYIILATEKNNRGVLYIILIIKKL